MNHEIYELNTKISALQVLAQKGKQKDNWTTEQMVPEEYHKYLSLFDEKKSKQFLPARTWDHKIEMKPTFEPKAFKPYKFSFVEIKEQEKFVEENLRKGYIKHSKSPMALPFFFVAKKGGKLWPCQDYRYLNKHTIKNTYPIPNVQSILDKLWGSKYFTAMDIQLGYNNICIYVTNFIWPYLHQFFDYSHGLNGYGKPLKRPFDQYQSHLEAISIGWDIRQINW